MGSHSVTCHPAEVTFPPCVVWPTLGSTTAGEQNRTAKYRIDSVCLHSTTVPLLEGSTSPLNPPPPKKYQKSWLRHCHYRSNCRLCSVHTARPDKTVVASGRVVWIESATVCRNLAHSKQFADGSLNNVCLSPSCDRLTLRTRILWILKIRSFHEF